MNEASNGTAGGWRTLWKNPAIKALIWAIGGGFVGYWVGIVLARTGWIEPYEPAIKAAIERDGWWLLAGWATLAVFALIGLVLIVTSMGDERLRKAMKLEVEESLEKPRLMLRISGVGMLAYGVVLGVFLFPGLDPVAGIVLGIAAFTLAMLLFFWGTRISDELQRAAQNEAIVWSFLIVEAVLIGWALLHHYGMADPISPLVLVLVLTLTYLAAGLIAAVKHGLTE
jgi:uncharacterized protein YjeT (DUF2065 family)